MVIGITAVFGLLGLIPTVRRAKKAERLGYPSSRYWKAFGITLAGMVVFFSILGSLGDSGTDSTASAATSEPATTAAAAKPAVTVKPTTAATKPAANDASYSKLTDRTWLKIVKDPASHAGEKVIIFGRINQFDSATGTGMFLATAGPTKYESESDTNTIFVGDAGMLGEFVEGDLFRAEAIVVGAHDYDTQIGGHTVAPKLQVTSIKAVSDK